MELAIKYAFLAVAALFDISMPAWGYIALLPALILSGLMLGAMGIVLSSMIRQLENFAGIMNFVIFPMFFLSSALYPLWRIRESSDALYRLCTLNPFTYAVELIRYSLYLKTNGVATLVVVVAFTAFAAVAIYAYDPARGIMSRKRTGA